MLPKFSGVNSEAVPACNREAHLVVVREVVAVLHALVAPDDVEELVVREEPGGHVGAEQAREAPRVGKAAGLVLKWRMHQ